MRPLVLHLIANAHLDPVWLWDWREGMNEGICTTRTILDLMDEDPDLTFVRGEVVQYRHLEEHDPETFARVRRYVDAGRWDVVGGTWLQADDNLPATETYARHFTMGLEWMRARFGRAPRVAWSPDAFGHSAGLPEIYAQAGIVGFACWRPTAEALPLAKPAFWWRGPSGARVLAYRTPVGWYGTERDEATRRLDAHLAHALTCDLENVGCFIGVGNHGGGPTRRQIADIRAWAARHPEVRVVWSGLHRLIDALYAEVARRGDDHLPTHVGELNFTLRGCYASVQRFKSLYRRAEAAVARAERTGTAIAAALGARPADLSRAWQAVLFNSFHDILPGSSIERAYDDQTAWLSTALHDSQLAELTAIDRLALRVDTAVEPPPPDHPSGVALIAFNPHATAFRGHLEIEASLDSRGINAYRGRPDALPIRVLGADRRALPFQRLKTEHDVAPGHALRYRVLVPAELPPLGWAAFEIGWVEGHAPPANHDGAPATGVDGAIANGMCAVEAAVGARGVVVRRGGRAVFGGDGLRVETVRDPYGSWGGMNEEPDSIDLRDVLHAWTVSDVALLERGPERAALWVRLAGGRSRLDLTFLVTRGRDAVDVRARLFLDERSSRVRLVMPGGDDAEFDVPGGSVRRAPCGEVPGGRWVRVRAPGGGFGFASDALYAFSAGDGALRATLARASYYANDLVNDPAAAPWRPSVDCGELRFRFLIAGGGDDLPRLARELEEPPFATMVAPRRGDLARSGSFAALAPASVRLLALKPAEDGDGVVVRVIETAGEAADVALTFLGHALALGRVAGHAIASWRLRRAPGAWTATRVDLAEREG